MIDCNGASHHSPSLSNRPSVASTAMTLAANTESKPHCVRKKCSSNVAPRVNPSQCDSTRPLINQSVPGNGTVTPDGSWLSTSLNCEGCHQTPLVRSMLSKPISGHDMGFSVYLDEIILWSCYASFTTDKILLYVNQLSRKVIAMLRPSLKCYQMNTLKYDSWYYDWWEYSIIVLHLK